MFYPIKTSSALGYQLFPSMLTIQSKTTDLNDKLFGWGVSSVSPMTTRQSFKSTVLKAGDIEDHMIEAASELKH